MQSLRCICPLAPTSVPHPTSRGAPGSTCVIGWSHRLARGLAPSLAAVLGPQCALNLPFPGLGTSVPPMGPSCRAAALWGPGLP